jgi:hypothetical protein
MPKEKLATGFKEDALYNQLHCMYVSRYPWA